MSQCEIKNVSQVMHLIKQLKLFCLDRDYGPVLNSFVKTQFKLQNFIWKLKAQAKQSILDSFFAKVRNELVNRTNLHKGF